jgi:UDP-N-acetylmuramyl pentapeptide phosphotransferase/UDP-N-acetylglucosamine-1-phosphate transferase
MTILFAFLTALAICSFSIPSIIRVAEIKGLFDSQDERKTHAEEVPTLGGIAIFAGLIFSLTFWSDQSQILELQYIIASLIILFFMGIKDDIVPLSVSKKLLGQIAAAAIIVHYTEIKLTNMYGLFGLKDLNIFWSYSLSIFTIIVVTNSFNLIDGINTLAGGLGLLASLSFGSWFLAFGSGQYALLAFCLAGALCGFLIYNKTPAKIFMGDTGSLILGFLCGILAIQFIETNRVLPRDHDFKVLSVPVVAVSILAIPLFDTLRVFIVRAIRGHSPFSADRRHVHHRLIDLGLSHGQASVILVFVNALAIVLVYFFQGLKGEILLGLVTAYLFIFDIALLLTSRKRRPNHLKDPAKI